jgi:hypothetical protein
LIDDIANDIVNKIDPFVGASTGTFTTNTNDPCKTRLKKIGDALLVNEIGTVALCTIKDYTIYKFEPKTTNEQQHLRYLLKNNNSLNIKKLFLIKNESSIYLKMSRSLLTHFFRKKVFHVENDNIVNIYFQLATVGIIFGSHACYAIGTKNQKTIRVKDKYVFTRNGFSEFMVIDHHNEHYNVNNSLWYWKWDSIEDWNHIAKNKLISIHYYGWRIPILGIFPNIYQTSHQTYQI